MEWSLRSIKSLMGNWQSTITYRSTYEYRGDKFANPIYKMEHQFWQNLTFSRKTLIHIQLKAYNLRSRTVPLLCDSDVVALQGGPGAARFSENGSQCLARDVHF